VKHVVAKKLGLHDEANWRFKEMIDRFGKMPLASIKTADIEDYVAELKEPRTVNGRPDQTLAPASINRRLQILRHMFNWAVGREYLEKTPFRRGTLVLIRMELEDNKRRRRISEDEETALIAVAPLHLRAMIITALDTGMRRGEMLALRFSDIDWNRRLITLRGPTTKSKKTRQVPIGTERLLAVLEWLRIDGAGERKPDSAPVFSNEAGEPLTIFKKAWTITVLKAHGVDTHWRKSSYKDLTYECQERLRQIDLHWHDLRHEYASRLVERGVPLAQVRDLLGHASITTTERYDNQTIEALSIAVHNTALAFTVSGAVLTNSRKPRRAAFAASIGNTGATNVSGPTGCRRNSNSVTTPKLPPPPLSAQKRSVFAVSLAVRHSPSAVITSAERRLSQLMPYVRRSQPWPPPSVRPATLVVETTPPGTASSKACVSRSSSPHVTPACTRAVRAAGSMLIPRMPDRSITRPPSHVAKPATLCAPPRTATTRSWVRAK
jgi:integrase